MKRILLSYFKKICPILEILAFFSQLLQSHIVLTLINLAFSFDFKINFV